MLQTFVNTSKLRIYQSMEDIIISLKSAKSKPNNPYSSNKQTSALDDTRDALRLALCCMRQKS